MNMFGVYATVIHIPVPDSTKDFKFYIFLISTCHRPFLTSKTVSFMDLRS